MLHVYKKAEPENGAAMTDNSENIVEQLIADGLLHHDAGEVEKARDAYLEALNQDPQNSKALDLAGLLCMQCGETEAAKDFYKSAIGIEPENTRFLLHLGILFLEQNNFKESEETLRKVLDLDGDHSDAMFYIALGMRAEGRRDEALVTLKGADLRDRENANYKKWLGLLAMETGDLVSALEETNQAAELDHRDVTIFFQLGTILHAVDDLTLAEKAYLTGLEVDPGDARCRSGLVAALIDLGRLEDAENELGKISVVDAEGHPMALSISALLKSVTEQQEEAKRLIESALNTDASSLEILLVGYRVMENLGENEAAEKLLEEMQAIAPDDARVMAALFG